MVDPTGYTALDLIGFTDKGDYNPLSTYNKNDLANYNGTKWRCKVDDTIGVTPSEGLTWTAFMVLPTDHTMDMIAPVETSPSANAYVTGKQLIFNEVLYDVIDDIAIGDTLEVGVNIDTSDTIVEKIEDANGAIAQNANDISDLNDEFYDAWQENGAYNLCPNTATSQVVNGITYTVNSNKTVSINGTQTASGNAYLTIGQTEKLDAGTYKIVGCPSGGGWSTYYFIIRKSTDGSTWSLESGDLGSGVELTVAEGTYLKLEIIIYSGTTVTDLTFKPMITTDLNATYADYQPYAMTNKELTEIKTITGTATNTTNNATMTMCSVDRVGKVCQFVFGLTTTVAVNVGENITFNISGIPIPKALSMISGYAGSTCALAQLTKGLVLNIRITSANTGSNYNIILSGTYVAEN